MNNRKKDNSTLFWIIAAVLMFLGIWPIAVPMVLIKLFAPDNRNTNRNSAPPLRPNYVASGRTNISSYNSRNASTYNSVSNANRVQTQSRVRETAQSMVNTPNPNNKSIALLWIFGVMLALLGIASISEITSFWSAMSSFGYLAGGASLIAGGVSLKNAGRRYNKYKTIIGSAQAVEISTLAKKMGVDEKRVLKDIDRMIEKGYFGNSAYVNVELGYLFLSSEADNELSKYREQALQAAKVAKEKQAADKLAEGYQSILRQIRDVNDRIAHPVMTEKIYRIEEITGNIFKVVQQAPEKRSMIDNFLSYYLPTTLKLLESYAQLEKVGVDGENITQSKDNIENAMDSIVEGFENQFDVLYKKDVLDIETDIDVMTRMMKQDSRTASDDFKIDLKKPSSAAKPIDNRTQFEKDFGFSYSKGSNAGGAAAQQVENDT